MNIWIIIHIRVVIPVYRVCVMYNANRKKVSRNRPRWPKGFRVA